MVKKILKSKKGQTSVEYLLMISVAVSLGITVFNKMNEYLIKNPDGMIGRPLKQFKDKFSADPAGRYRYYRIVK